MLKRILSAIFLIVVLVPIVLAGGKVFSLAVGILSLLGFKEILDLKKSHTKYPSVLVLISMILLLFLIFYELELHPFGISYTVIAILCIIYLLPTLLEFKNEKYETKDAFYILGFLLFLGISFHAVIVYRNRDLNLFLYLILISILTDTFALFIGKFLGKRKIAPTISPNKTIAGSVGGTLFGTIIPSIFYYFMVSKKEWYIILLVTILLSVASQLGDLFFSKIKRENGVKDFSNLIPEHGGVLDRFDSLIFVVLAFLIIERFI